MKLICVLKKRVSKIFVHAVEMALTAVYPGMQPSPEINKHFRLDSIS